ncbi:uncharacterized protein LOC143363596, partial [Halictus rubicundus]|uniref:uncharacterized protein LOC143363596 n=1 Tax=Halictus rubicundus TaxID=77578 RepID=UPI004036064A
MADELKSFIRQRAAVKAQLTRLSNQVRESILTFEVTDIEMRQKKLEEYFQKFFIIQDQVESIQDKSDEEAIKDFEATYFECSDLLARRLRELTHRTQIQTVPTVSNASTPTITTSQDILPKIRIKQFSGNFLEWQGFYDTFRSLVHEVDTIPTIHKFHLLKSYLIGNAANVTSALSASEENYFVAWNLLRKRFDQPRKIIQCHIRALFELPEVSRDKPSSLRALAEDAEMHINALKSLGQPVEWDEMIIYIISSKLDKSTRTSWERTIEDGVLPTYHELLAFLNKYSRDEEPVKLVAHTRDNNYPKRWSDRSFKPVHRTNTFVGTKPAISCPVCKQSHYINQCTEFLKQSPRDRITTVKTLKGCLNCLNSTHFISQCRSSTCRKCGGKHHTLLHIDQSNVSNVAKVNTLNEAASPTIALTAYSKLDQEVLLSTARVKILDQKNREHECRVLLDPGSQRNFMTERLATYLRLPKKRLNVTTSGIGRQESHVKFAVEAQIGSNHSDFKCSALFLTLPEITGPLPSRTFERTILQIPNNVALADPSFNRSSKVDLLLGEYLYYKLLGKDRIRLQNETVVLQDTELGWVLSGEINDSVSTNINCHLNTQDLDAQLERFWQVEQCSVTNSCSPQEQLCEELFKQSTYRDKGGRYIVRLPFNDNKQQLGNSYDIALKRFYSLERRLQSNTELRDQYTKFLTEYEALDHMTEVEDKDFKDAGCYLPHHPIIKASSLTTKVRVVFDASAKTDTGLSLNHALMVGPTIQDDVFSLIARFRKYQYVITADIEKMFRQILVHPEDANYQKILWRKGPNEAVKSYRLNTVTYGTACAPFLAARCLQQLAEDEARSYPLAVEVIKNDFYMDDLLTGTNSSDEAAKLIEQLTDIFQRGGMNLRQWSSNKPQLLKGLQERTTDDCLCLDPQAVKKTLGIYWHPREDTIGYKVTIDNSTQNTKRLILSKIAQLFDPLGLLGPVIVKAKIIMQALWKAKLGWDDLVPSDIRDLWKTYKEQLALLNEFSVPRETLIKEYTDVQLHGFCDASETAYGACIYIRSSDAKNRVKINLIAAKSRVAPLKTISIPRLELCAALGLAELYNMISKSLKIQFNSVHFWSDSTITLHWIRTAPHTLKTFVANRVSKIQEVTNEYNWRHIISSDNPADCLSRGQLPSEFLANRLWQKGPTWLSELPTNWPKTTIPNIDVPEQRSIVSLATRISNSDFLNRFSSWIVLQRAIAYCVRFCKNASRCERNTGPLSIFELKRAHNCVIKNVQGRHFAKEYTNLTHRTAIHKDSKILALTPFIDDEGIIRVGGRLQNSDLRYSQRHPILLPRSDHITRLIIEYEHRRQLHTGILGTLNAVRQRYWPIDGKNLTRHIVRKCMRCFKVNPLTAPDYPMGNLPRDRVMATRPFQTTGVDFCGPFFIKEKKHRNTKKIKVYVAVFVCFVTKAIHLELVSELSTEAFIATLRRFFSRRGYASTIYSDNGTNFVGAKNKLDEIQAFLTSEQHKKPINSYLNSNGISWHFSPPRTPHFGGLWEAAVKTFKHQMYRTIGDTLFSFEVFNTYITEIEAILNSRPLTPLSSDPNDLSALTPAHFLIGESLTNIPERDVSDIATNRLSVWEHIQKMKQHFWTRWYK